MAAVPVAVPANLQNVIAQLAYQGNVGIGRTRIQAHFVPPNPIPADMPGPLQVLCMLTTFRNAPTIAVGDYVMLQKIVDGLVPTIANLQLGLHLTVFRICAVTPDNMTLQWFTTFNDDASAALALANSTTTYGPHRSNLYFPIPADGADPLQFLVPNTNLRDTFALLDPFLQVPAAAAVVVPPAGAPAPQDHILQQLVNGQHNIAATQRLTVEKEYNFHRFQSMERLFPEGRFALSLRRYMFALPEGQPPSAGYLGFCGAFLAM